jgi:hypothetical protein
VLLARLPASLKEIFMSIALYAAAVLTVLIGVAHSYLGERYVLVPLLRITPPPKPLHSRFIRRALRFAWHITSIAWVGFAAILALLAQPSPGANSVALVLAITFWLTSALILVSSRGRHLAWPLFLLIGAIAFYASRI